ncbi:hypothetical protein BASA81_006726 [Batrachochytrium salamandrivorans]|nr:hypothetical protein BASA81_006726 [Batrachochytrium salamandrivorans]
MFTDLPNELFDEVVEYLSPNDVAVLVQCNWGCLHRLQGFEMPSLDLNSDLLEARQNGPWKWTIAPVGERFELNDSWMEDELGRAYAEHFPEALLSVRHLHLTCSSGDFWPDACEHLDLFINCQRISSIAFEGLQFGNFAQEIIKLTQLVELQLDSSYSCLDEQDFNALLELVTKHKLIRMELMLREMIWVSDFAKVGKWQGLRRLTMPFCSISEFQTLVTSLSNDTLRELVLCGEEEEDNDLTLNLAKKICKENGLVKCVVTHNG